MKGHVMVTNDSICAKPARKRLNIGKEVAAMQRMTTGELAEKYAEVFGESTRSRHRQYLIKRIAWRMQANAEGGLSERARRRAAELANDADLRVSAPRKENNGRTSKTVRARTPATVMPGTVLEREYKGKVLHVVVRANGFEHEGKVYKSLSAVANDITGSHVNGFRFFQLGRYGGQK
jgi:hypothetical protein